MGDLSVRPSDDDRERAALALREHLVDGRLTLEEFSERVELAYRARSAEELEATGAALPASRGEPRRRRSVRATIGLFSHVVRRGRLKLGRFALVIAGLADVDLDLREAEIAQLTNDVLLLVAVGNVDLYVPERVAVEVTGLTVFGHRRQWGRDVAGADDPVLRVRVLAVFGTVDVWHVPSEMRGTYGQMIKALRRNERELPR